MNLARILGRTIPFLAAALASAASAPAARGLVTLPAPPEPRAALQDDEELPDKRPEIDELLDRLSDHVGQRGDEDREAIAVVDQLAQEFPKSGPKDRAAIVKGLDKAIKAKRKPTEEDLPDNRLHIAVATALGLMGPESVDPLADWIGHKQHKDDLALQRVLILSLGQTRDEDGVKPMLKLLDHHEPQIQAATAEALANFDEADEDLRKEIFEDLLRTLMRVRAVIDQDVNELIEHQRWEVISGPIVSSLQKLSGHQEHDAHEWQRWWNKNKKEDWDSDEES